MGDGTGAERAVDRPDRQPGPRWGLFAGILASLLGGVGVLVWAGFDDYVEWNLRRQWANEETTLAGSLDEHRELARRFVSEQSDLLWIESGEAVAVLAAERDGGVTLFHPPTPNHAGGLMTSPRGLRSGGRRDLATGPIRVLDLWPDEVERPAPEECAHVHTHMTWCERVEAGGEPVRVACWQLDDGSLRVVETMRFEWRPHLHLSLGARATVEGETAETIWERGEPVE